MSNILNITNKQINDILDKESIFIKDMMYKLIRIMENIGNINVSLTKVCKGKDKVVN